MKKSIFYFIDFRMSSSFKEKIEFLKIYITGDHLADWHVNPRLICIWIPFYVWLTVHSRINRNCSTSSQRSSFVLTLVSRFRCPKGWKRLGGSCYYFSNATSTSTYVNYTCNYLHSNYSNLMQVRNAVEFVYAAHVLTRNNLTSLMIEIEPNLLTGEWEEIVKVEEIWRNEF